MELQVKELEHCVLEIHYEADADQIQSKKTEVLTSFKDMPVKGFREGKAPMDAVRIYYAKQIDNALKQALAEHAYFDAIGQKNLKPFGVPDFSTIELSRNKFVCDFKLRIKPDFEIKPYKDLEIPKQDTKFDVVVETEKMLESLRTRFGESTPFEETDFICLDDMAIVDYDAFDGEEKIVEASGSGQILTVGKSIIPGFDDNLLGMKLGDTRTFYITAPDTSLPSFAGKSLKIVLSLTMASKIIPMALDDVLAKKLGKETLEEVRQYVSGIAEAKKQETERAAHSQQIMARLVADNEVKIPSWLILSEAKYITAAAEVDFDKLEDTDKEEYLKMSENNVKTALILDKIREAEPEAQLSDQEVISMIEQNLKKTRSETEVNDLLADLNKTGKLAILAARIRDEFVVDFLLKNIKWLI